MPTTCLPVSNMTMAPVLPAQALPDSRPLSNTDIDAELLELEDYANKRNCQWQLHRGSILIESGCDQAAVVLISTNCCTRGVVHRPHCAGHLARYHKLASPQAPIRFVCPDCRTDLRFITAVIVPVKS